MSDVARDFRTVVEAFVGDLRTLIRRQALEAIAEATLQGEGVTPAPAPRRGRPAAKPVTRRESPKAPAAAAVAPVKSTRAPKPLAAPAKRAAGEKRTPRLLEQLTSGLHDYIKSNAGQNVEQISRALGTPTRELALPLRKLLAGKRISSKGQKRATRYFPR